MIENVLYKEHSHYLKRHANNPVAWQIWNNETLELAKRLNKPIFISIGYSSCHWCHIMAHESFEDNETASILNENFIPIKIDKEEYPEIDKKYQFYIQITNKQGGWPLSVFATPEGEPFFAGTYFPKEEKYGIISLKNLLNQMINIFHNQSEQIDKSIKKYNQFISDFYKIDNFPLHLINISQIHERIISLLDFKKGGLKGNNKFPNIPYLLYLLESEDENLLDYLYLTGKKLALSGLYDHINGGFFRYCVDENWSYPHFEKMLYDNALNSLFLIKLYEKTKEPLFYHIARKTLDFILEEFNTENGLIASMNADSLNEEGKFQEGYFYHLHEEQLSILPQNLQNFIINNNGFIYLKDNVDYETYKKLDIYFEKISENHTKEKPEKDNKIICSWNMLFVDALLTFAEITNDDYYFNHAVSLFNKLKTFQISKSRIYRINYHSEIFKHETLEDYSFTIMALIHFFEMTKEKEFLSLANSITKTTFEKFYNENYLFLDINKSILDTFDDAIYSPVGIMGLNLHKLTNYISNDNFNTIKSIFIDRGIKYSTGHPTILRLIRRVVDD
ncbi:thioredoxin domain-containing protein [Deferribacter abyssi]|uniref:thioredoxin domain-containing protein n=1 Tax=Deferribacter abyssi TaxID=213806 RepID=UPI003C1AEB90